MLLDLNCEIELPMPASVMSTSSGVWRNPRVILPFPALLTIPFPLQERQECNGGTRDQNRRAAP